MRRDARRASAGLETPLDPIRAASALVDFRVLPRSIAGAGGRKAMERESRASIGPARKTTEGPRCAKLRLRFWPIGGRCAPLRAAFQRNLSSVAAEQYPNSQFCRNIDTSRSGFRPARLVRPG